MITQYQDFTDNQPSKNQEKIKRKRMMMVFENYWNNSVLGGIDNLSVKSYLTNIGNLCGEEVHVSHRFIDSKKSLSYYIGENGIMWNFPESLNFSLWYFGFHGVNTGIELPQEIITKDDILELFDGKFSNFPNVLYFSSCYLFEDDDFGYSLLKKSGSQGIVGFSTEIPFSTGTIIDLLFLSSFFLCKNPFDNLQYIYDEIIRDFPVSQRDYGFKLFC